MDNHSYVARQAILDRQQRLHGYELLYRDGEHNAFPDIGPDIATTKLLAEQYLSHGFDELIGGKRAFINFHEQALLQGLPKILEPSQVVIEILETVPPSKALLDVCRELKKMGYRLALDDHDFDSQWGEFLPFVDLVKVDLMAHGLDEVQKNLTPFREAGVKLLAERVETQQEFEQCKDLGFDYFQGFFFARPQMVKRPQLALSRLSLLELTAEANAADLNLAKVNALMENDVALSYRLLRFINNPLLYKSQPITSLRHALNFLGQIELKKFIGMMVMAAINTDKPAELTHVALIRAKFCELLARDRGDKGDPPAGFLLGLFSTLDALLDQPMQYVVDKLPLAEEIRQALCGEGKLYAYLALIEAMERAEWQKVGEIAQRLDVTEQPISQFYRQALEWGDAMNISLAEPRPA
ncbi:uncharacterized protein HMF8227_00348 [Saliniradius amylolyticus]|uniref:Uncharacterized protein n=1 Tax=Saliniradius amylolyticus TaxID=2183582 RepID=A0A2S2DZM8_9ALTE|nr:EAL domain-containing protein [Saliniradius amylolyticus]AWL10854.1 uncharacterized protein HMF8227_00348 [Saliniradius amylolyticus]